MAIVTTPIFYLGTIPTSISGAGPTFTNSFVLNSATDQLELIVGAPTAGNITAVGLVTGVVTTGCTVEVRIETVSDTTGRASGSLVTAGASATQVIANTDDNVWFNITLGTAASVTRGQPIAIVIDVSSGTPATLRFAQFSTGGGPLFPFLLVDDGTPAVLASAPVLTLSYGGTYYQVDGAYPIKASSSDSYSTSSAKDTFGLRFQVPHSVRVCGIWWWGDTDGDCSIELLDGSDAVLTSLTFDKDIPYADTGIGLFRIPFTAQVTLTAGTTYRLAIRAMSTSNVILYHYTIDATAMLAASHLGSSQMYMTEADYGAGPYGAWTDTNTKVPWIGLICDGMEAGGGGTSVMRVSVSAE